jgi:hydroxyacyl-ACP dehydratase HTD2-like protein with hotdog domain
MIQDFSYKNIAPLYVEEKMHICTKKVPTGGHEDHKYDIWIAGPAGGYAVKGRAIVKRPSRWDDLA